MMSETTEKRIISECRKLCETFRLSQAYLAEVVGPRRHYLAGYGRSSQGKPEQLPLSTKIAILWHGDLPSEAQTICERHFHSLTERLEQELASPLNHRNKQKRHRQHKET